MLSNARVAKTDLIGRAIAEAQRSVDDLPDLPPSCSPTTATCPTRDWSVATRSTCSALPSRSVGSLRNVRSARPRPGLQPHPRGPRLGVAAHRRRDRHRRHAVPRRLRHLERWPRTGLSLHLVVHPQFTVERTLAGRAAKRAPDHSRGTRGRRVPWPSRGCTSRSIGSPTPTRMRGSSGALRRAARRP